MNPGSMPRSVDPMSNTAVRQIEDYAEKGAGELTASGPPTLVLPPPPPKPGWMPELPQGAYDPVPSDRHPGRPVTSTPTRFTLKGRKARAKLTQEAAREINRRQYLNVRIRALTMVSGGGPPRCVACGCDEPAVLELNHKKGGGSREVKRMGRSGTSLYADIVAGRRSLGEFDVRCRPCNHVHFIGLRRPVLAARWKIIWI